MCVKYHDFASRIDAISSWLMCLYHRVLHYVNAVNKQHADIFLLHYTPQ